MAGIYQIYAFEDNSIEFEIPEMFFPFTSGSPQPSFKSTFQKSIIHFRLISKVIKEQTTWERNLTVFRKILATASPTLFKKGVVTVHRNDQLWSVVNCLSGIFFLKKCREEKVKHFDEFKNVFECCKIVPVSKMIFKTIELFQKLQIKF